jgi:hypothetical protein
MKQWMKAHGLTDETKRTFFSNSKPQKTRHPCSPQTELAVEF